MNARTWRGLVGPWWIVVVVGCAPAYHSYTGCYVDCHYCAPPPLPYMHYEGCTCHACVAQPYLHEGLDVVEQIPDYQPWE